MIKLLEAFKKCNSLANAKKLQAWERKHPFAACMLTADDGHILNEAILLAVREG